MIEKFLEGNKRFREEDFEKNADHYDTLASSQHPSVLWIGCSDSRVDAEASPVQAGGILCNETSGTSSRSRLELRDRA